MGNAIKTIGCSIVVIAIFHVIFFIATLIIMGYAWLSIKVLPWLYIVMWLVFKLDIFIILPLGIFKKTKGISAIGLVVSSFVYGLTLWLLAFLVTYKIWGPVAVLIGLIFGGVGVVPIAMLAATIKGHWAIVGSITLLLFFTYGAGILGLYFAQRADELAYSSSFED